MSELSLRLMQIHITPQKGEILPGIELIEHFNKFEFLTLVELLEDGMHCLVKADYEDSNVLDKQYRSFQLLKKIEVKQNTALIEIRTLGPIPKVFSQLSGAWWISPTYVDMNGLWITIRGTSESLRISLDKIKALLGKTFNVKSSSKTQLNPTIISDLPSKQKNVLQKAIDLGYYSRPRKTTQKAIAESLGVKQATVSEHLQNAEARIIADYTKNFEI